MLERTLKALIVFVITNGLLIHTASFLFNVGLFEIAATSLSVVPAISFLGLAWWVLFGVRKTDVQTAGLESVDEKNSDGNRKISTQLLFLILLVFVAAFGGCTNWPLPPSKTQALKSFHIGGNVGVYRAPSANVRYEEMDRVIKQIRATGLFDRVDRLGSFKEPPTYKVEYRGSHWCSDTFPRSDAIFFRYYSSDGRSL